MKPAILFLALFGLTACQHQPAPKTEITVAAAANLTDVLGRIGPQFEAATGIHPTFSFASTAQLARQIESAAPFDVFAAADSAHVAELDRKGFLAPGSRAIYARGILALWIPAGGKATIRRIEDLTQPDVHVIAIAKPELAPYGQASLETLEKLGIWNRLKSKVVYAENINMAREYGQSHNADAVFTAYSLVLHETGQIIQVNENLHNPINQELAIVAKSKRPDAAKRFVNFLLTGEGKSILANSGYLTPASN